MTKLQTIQVRDATDKGPAGKVVERLQQLRKEQHAREATVGVIDVEARTVELSFSSEIEYPRWWGIEILGHDAHEVNLQRLNNGAPLLWMHNWNDQRGVVVPGSARIDSDRKGRLVARYSRSADGDRLFQDIVDGIVTKVSVGYTIDGLVLVAERDGVEVYRVTSWTPLEVSNVSVPADDTVGVGRKLENPQEEQKPGTGETSPSITDSAATRATTKENKSMFRTFHDANGNLCRVATDADGKDIGAIEIVARANNGTTTAAPTTKAQVSEIDAERARVKDLGDMGRTYGCTDKAMAFIAEGKTAEDLRRVLLDDYAQARSGGAPLAEVQDANIGLNQKEIRAFSLMKAIRVLADPDNAAFRKAAGFEMECHRAASELYGKNSKGIIIPNDVLADRTFATTTGGGSNLIASQLMSGSLIELLRKKTWLMKRARTLAGLVGNVDIPRQNGSGSVYWVGEGQGPQKSQPSFDQIAFTPKTMGSKSEITRRLMMQATPDAENLVRDDLLKNMALELDRVGIYGTGSAYQPKGLRNITGINTKAFATAGQPTYAELVAMETEIAADDADVESMSYAFNAAIRGHAKTTLKFPAAGSGTIWEPGNTVNGYAANVSNQIAAGEVLLGNWADLVIAFWGGLELTVDPYSLSDSGGLKLVALQDLDINVRHVESFCIGA